MTRLLTLFFFLTLLGAGAAWLADHPGNVTMVWMGWRIDMSMAVLLLVAALAIIAASYVFLFVRFLVRAPRHFSERRELKHYKKGVAELTHTIAALAASDAASAEAHTRKAEKLLGKTPLTLLLSAQIARSQNDEGKTHALLSQMLEHEETEYLAARSLAEAASKNHAYGRALALAERAHAANPKDPHSVEAVVSLHLRLGGWQEALQAVEKSRGAYAGRAGKNRHRGLIYTAQAQAFLDKKQPDAALSHARLAVKFLPDFVPAALAAARAFIACGQPEKAAKLIAGIWRLRPHPQLAAIWRVAMAKEPKERQLKHVQHLAAYAPEHPESQLAIAEMAIKHQEWALARRALGEALSREDSARACKLMAYVEQGERGDSQAANHWLMRSADAIPDPAWICESCSHAAESWSVHCEACGAFDTQTWKSPRPMVHVAAA